MRKKGETIGVVDFGSRDVRVLIACRDSEGSIQVVGHGTSPGRGCVSQGVIQIEQIEFGTAPAIQEGKEC